MKKDKLKKIIQKFAPSSLTISGELLQIFGLGVLIVGDSGIGKSESALELVSRGCRLISDDVVHIKRGAGSQLIGEAPSISRHFMEIRGLGIINIKEIFGSRAILKRAKVDLVINLKKIQRRKDYDRLGLKFPEDYGILGQKIPQINIPVAPGRNIATMIEVACKVHVLRNKGYHAPQHLVRKLNRALSVP